VSYGELKRLSWEDRETVNCVSWGAAEHGGQIAVDVLGDGEVCEMRERRIEFEPLCIPWMHVRCVEIEELICFVKRLHLHDRTVYHLGRRQLPCSDIQQVATQCAAVDAVARPHRCGGIVAKIRHALGERLEIKRDLVAITLVKHLCMMGIAPGLDHRQSRIGALGRGEMLIEDRALREKTRNMRHILRKARAVGGVRGEGQMLPDKGVED